MSKEAPIKLQMQEGIDKRVLISMRAVKVFTGYANTLLNECAKLAATKILGDTHKTVTRQDLIPVLQQCLEKSG
jgi:histone H3/H4